MGVPSIVYQAREQSAADYKRFVRRIAIAVLLGISAPILACIVKFVAAQPTSLLRNIALHPIALLSNWPVAVAAGFGAFLALRQPGRRHLVVCASILVLAIIAWWAVARPPVNTWLLPAVGGK